MEELLNKLLEKGWKPFESETQKAREGVYCKKYFFFEGCADGKSLRELVSKESGLWQFCVENKLVETDDDYSREKYRYNHGMKKEYKSRVIKGEARKYQVDYEYWIIESALKDESELEQFLLDNIKVEG